MAGITLSRAEFRDKVLGCWLGKNIGGTLGTPHEGKRFALGLKFYDPVPREPLPNDDLDLQLVWLECLEQVGLEPTVRDLAEWWSRHAAPYPWNEYGFFMRNFARGLRPPVAGCFENYFVDEMGSPIRSEIWAVLHAGDPQKAAQLAWRDSALDHAGGEGTWGEMFWAAVEAAAFVEHDPQVLIRIGLDMIPIGSHISRVIREALHCHARGLAWGDARERIVLRFGHVQPCNAIPNHGFTILGWLYGRDFGDRLLAAVNCGFDTDCTGATLGSVLGIIDGAAAIPAEWIRPIGRGIKLHKFTRCARPPRDVDELTDRSIALAERAAAASDGERAFGERTVLPADLRARLRRTGLAVQERGRDAQMGVELLGRREVEFHYGGDPVLRPGEPREVWVTLDGVPAAEARLTVPKGWRCTALGGGRFRLESDGPVAPRNQVTVTLPAGSAGFTVLGPDEAQGFAAGDNVVTCPDCYARVGACVCEPGRRPWEAITAWRVIGTWPAARGQLDDPTPVERDLAALDGRTPIDGRIWAAVTTDAAGCVDLDAVLGRQEWVVAYALAEVASAAARETVLFLGSDDGVKAWVDGAPVHRHDIGRGLKPAQDLVPVRLAAGTSRIVLKIHNHVAGWGFQAGVLRPHGG